MDAITLIWHGHACFELEYNGFHLVFDPYRPGKVPGLAPLQLKADLVLCSHNHDDHNWTEVVECSGIATPFTVRALTSFHDAKGGAVNGANLLHIVDAGKLRVVHFGDIGCIPDAEQLELIGQPTVALIPVGGAVTLAVDTTKRLADLIGAKVTIPMHYRGANFGFLFTSPVENFLALCNDVVDYDSNRISITAQTKKQTAHLKYVP